MSTNTTAKRPGRPPVTINWPSGENGFTVEQLEATTSLSKVTLYQKIKEALDDNIIAKTGKESSSKGRPRIVFKKVVLTGATADASA